MITTSLMTIEEGTHVPGLQWNVTRGGATPDLHLADLTTTAIGADLVALSRGAEAEARTDSGTITLGEPAMEGEYAARVHMTGLRGDEVRVTRGLTRRLQKNGDATGVLAMSDADARMFMKGRETGAVRHLLSINVLVCRLLPVLVWTTLRLVLRTAVPPQKLIPPRQKIGQHVWPPCPPMHPLLLPSVKSAFQISLRKRRLSSRLKKKHAQGQEEWEAS